MTMTTKELLALVGLASELPWEAYSSEVWSVGNNREVAHRPDFNTTPNGYGQWGANAALIVAAVNALPALCAEVEALKADLAACHRYVAARDAFDYAAEKYGEESNCAAMKPVRREVLAAVKEYRAVLAKEPK